MKRKSNSTVNEPTDEDVEMISLITGPSVKVPVKRKRTKKSNIVVIDSTTNEVINEPVINDSLPIVDNTSNQPIDGKFHILSIDIGIKNLGYTIISYDKLGKKELTDLSFKFDIFDISKHLKKKKDIVSSRCEALIVFFNELFNEYGYFQSVIVERQVNQNTMAMELMYAITMALKIMNKPTTNQQTDIVIFDPKDKFLKLDLEYSTKNKAHKKQSIRYAKNILELTHPELLNMFNVHDKKDDISDSLNQALVWMLVNGFLKPTIEEYKQIINGTQLTSD